MKTLFLFTLVAFLPIAADAKKMKGVIVYAHDTIHVTFNIPVGMFNRTPVFERLQYRVSYQDAQGNKKVLKPGQAKEIIFNNNGENIRLLSRHNSVELRRGDIFLHLVADGELKLFKYYKTRHTSGGNPDTQPMNGQYLTIDYLLQKRDGNLKRPGSLNFRKDMIEYFQDCPDLSEKIDARLFRRNDLEAIVRYYNSKCSSFF